MFFSEKNDPIYFMLTTKVQSSGEKKMKNFVIYIDYHLTRIENVMKILKFILQHISHIIF
jgi:hypothetical protein